MPTRKRSFGRAESTPVANPPGIRDNLNLVTPIIHVGALGF
jgi:hypothetical protein